MAPVVVYARFFWGGAPQCIQGAVGLKKRECFLAESSDGAVGNSQRLHSASRRRPDVGCCSSQIVLDGWVKAPDKCR